MTELKKIRRALISVSDKTGIVELAATLKGFGVEIVSTGGTAAKLRAERIDVIEVADVTGFPEMMDGRVKTLHPKIHGAFLALRDNDEHQRAMSEHGIGAIDLVVVNLYPFEETAADEEASLEEVVEQIDIGGPAMIRSASKNWRDVAVVTDAALYPDVIKELEETGGSISLKTRQRFAALSYTRTSYYDLAISSYLAEKLPGDDLDYLEPLNPFKNLAFIELETEEADDAESMPAEVDIRLAKVADLRYGENPHQNAALYSVDGDSGIANAEQLHGKEMSFNNYVDAEAAWRLVADFQERAVAIIKHTNPSGVGLGSSNLVAHQRALATDPVSAFGGIVALNRTADAEVAASVNKVFTEVVIAPDYEPEALDIFRKKKNLRILRLATAGGTSKMEHRQIGGGFLVQDQDNFSISRGDLTVAGEVQPTDEQIAAMLLAWKVCKHVKSNAIVFANKNQTVGVGAGQMNRVDSVRIAAMRAKRTELAIEGTVLASDAFFPFRDNVDEAAAFGISAIIQPGGSKRDDESIAAANEHGMAMVFTGYRHFKH
ncbi:MAG: bifunctional phosphoribosylaminoimidazolecarboxamide formyltransferase/IMP cyclohydrolase [Acidobacteriota bacterium]|nr:bifunctional phosphoribosylaminoimidazolecarboxamide formyltransferase/IMP cyclohydrolase [Acidobacteriota bacterium]